MASRAVRTSASRRVPTGGNRKTFDNSDTTITTLVNEYHLDPDSMLRTQPASPTTKAQLLGEDAEPHRTAECQRRQWRQRHTFVRIRTVTLQSDYSTKFRTGSMGHEFLAGMEYLNEDSFRHGLRNFGGTTNANPPMFYPTRKR